MLILLQSGCVVLQCNNVNPAVYDASCSRPIVRRRDRQNYAADVPLAGRPNAAVLCKTQEKSF